MLSWSLAFFIAALICGLFGFASIAAAVVGKVLFFIFLVLTLVALVADAYRT